MYFIILNIEWKYSFVFEILHFFSRGPINYKCARLYKT